jgi:hypothetical protein
MHKWILGLLVVLVFGLGVGFAVVGHDNDWGSDRGDVVTRSVSADGSELVVVHDDHRGFFPFGVFFFPLVLFFAIFVFRGFAFRGRYSGPGAWMHGGPGNRESPGWFDEWHRRAHVSSGAEPDRQDGSPAS